MSDSAQRLLALQTDRSFIVQAPAGSGKTELLIQRFLALLATVELPEQVIAITFTRKAAAQMRDRVLAALTAAAREERPGQPHRLRTFELARQALVRDRHLGWTLVEQPARLKIDTLDALNVWLAQRLPIASGGIGAAHIVEDASEYYLTAGRRMMQQLGDGSPGARALRFLLEASDIGAGRMVTLMAQMLATRDQWLPHLFGANESELRVLVERALRRSIEEDLFAVAQLIPEATGRQLVPLLRHVARHAPKYARPFEPWLSLEALPARSVEHLKAWKGLPELLLTGQGTWRKQPAAIGFSGQFATLGSDLKELISSLSDSEELRLALVELKRVPDSLPGSAWWDAVSAIRISLQHLVAELRILFAERNTADFIELALAAQRALGNAARPSDLLLALDRRIQHILVEEFEDTSRSQIRLLELLTSGWEPGDSRSLFLVGDPMQSIYRFRNADMSLFLRAKHEGIGDIRCETLDLTRNFRSAPVVIDWVNDTFTGIFPAGDDLRAGATRFSPCEAVRATSGRQTVEVHGLRGSDPDAETRRAAEIVAAERALSESGSVAILVRSRSHLAGLQSHLRALGLDAHAVQLEAPAQHQVTQDLIGLTRALTHRGDRVAWLGVLRAPWCGLRWTDLHGLCKGDSDSAVWTLMHDAGRIAMLTEDGQARLKRLRAILQMAFDERSAQPLARWVQRTWLTLDGPDCLLESRDMERAEHFFAVLREATVRGDLDDPTALDRLFDDPAAIVDRPRESGIEIMTIHKAKGLEFDTVVLPGLGREARSDQGKALYWHERVHADGEESVLLAPFCAGSDEPDSHTRWLRGIEQRKEYSERARLLYVATTRARERLHLIGQLAVGQSRPRAGSLLAFLWPQVSPAFESAGTPDDTGQQDEDAFEPQLRRLIDTARQREGATVPDEDVERRPHFQWAGQAALQVGVVVHQWLHTIARDGIERWNAERVRAGIDRYGAELQLLGVDEDALREASYRVMQALEAVLDDATGQWILTTRTEADSELPISRDADGMIENLRLDRTFVDESGTRWIIDYKTSAHEGGSIDAFLDSEVQRYRGQLERYAQAMSSIDSRPTRVGLYFPLLRAFREWQP
ncbi:MAG: AAA family ATPase [Proteobacteria bacterium]|nr:AAA family ATPase [Pseudomonadota bacterium]